MYLRNTKKIEIVHTKEETLLKITGGNSLSGLTNFLDSRNSNSSEWIQMYDLFEDYLASQTQTITIRHSLSEETSPEIVHVYPEDPRPVVEDAPQVTNLVAAA